MGRKSGKKNKVRFLVMRIGFIITNISFSGAQNVFNSVTSELSKRGHEIYILATNESNDFTDISERRYGLKSNKGSRYMRQIRRIVGIKEVALKHELDCMVAFGFNSNIKGIIASKLCHIPVVICERMAPDALTNKLLKLERALVYPKADGYIFQTKEIRNFFSKKIQKKSFIIPNPVREETKDCVATRDRKKIIATVTRLDEKQKNLLHLIRSFKEFHVVNPDYRLLIIGDGPDNELIQKEIRNCNLNEVVELAGRVERPLDYIADTDIFTLVSYHEGMPNALIEAMSIGLPCVVEHFSGGAAEELIVDGVNGILLHSHSQKQLVEALSMLVKNVKLKEKIAINAYNINETLALDKIVSMWEKAIYCVVSSNIKKG